MSGGSENNEELKSPRSPPPSPVFLRCFTSSAGRYEQNLALIPENDESPIDDSGQPNQQHVITVPPRSHRHASNSSSGGSRKIAVAEEKLLSDDAATSSKSNDDDQDANRATVRERNATMLYNDCMADVWFLVGQATSTDGTNQQQRIPAHSYVLATGSSVFYAMFFGGFTRSEDIVIPDVDPVAFRILLKYLYTDEIDLDADTVLSTLYVSKKYLVTHLTRACIHYLETSLNAHNVCLLLAQSRLFEEEELMQRCWDVVDAQTEMALMSDGFLDVDSDTLEAIICRETLSCREMVVFNAAVRWAEAECSRRQIDPSAPNNKRAVLGQCFQQIRFPSMKVEEFANGPAQSGLLDAQEVANIFLFHFARRKPELIFVTRPRLKLPLQRCHRFQSSAYRGNQWRYRGRCDSIQFCTDKRIFVIGFGLYGSSNGSAEYKVLIELKRSGQILASVASRLYTDGSSNVFAVYFDQPVQVEPDVFYTASAILDGGELSFFGQEGLPEVQVDRVTFQFQCSTESTNGTGVQGGQIPEILFYG